MCPELMTFFVQNISPVRDLKNDKTLSCNVALNDLSKKKKNKHPTITTANDTSRYLKWLLLKRNQMSTSKEQLLLERKLLNDRCNEYFGVLFQNIFKQRSSASLQSSSAMHYSPLHR